MYAAILYVKLAPFHFARLEAAGKLWAERGFRLTCLETANEQANYSWGESQYSSEAFNYVTLFKQEYFTLRYSEVRRAINSALDEARPDVVVINGWGHKESMAALGWCLRNSVPRVVVSDSQEVDWTRHWWKESIKRAFVSRCHAGFAGGAPHVRYLETLGLPSEFCVTGCDVVDNEMFFPSASRRRAGAVEQLRILSCLRFLTIKNVPRALHSLSMSQVPWVWTLAGDGPDRGAIEDSIESQGLQDRVRLLGHISYQELPDLYQKADVYLQPSLSEPWGLAVNEAMASGLPVVVSDRCGCHEDLVREGVNGYTFDPLSDESLAEVMGKMWERRQQWAQMGEASLKIIKRWSLDFFAGNLWRACEFALLREKEQSISDSLIARLCSVL